MVGTLGGETERGKWWRPVTADTQRDALMARIHAYYDQTWGDYRWLWLSPRNYAIHFGYWDSQTRTYAASLLNMNKALATSTACSQDNVCSTPGVVWATARSGWRGRMASASSA